MSNRRAHGPGCHPGMKYLASLCAALLAGCGTADDARIRALPGRLEQAIAVRELDTALQRHVASALLLPPGQRAPRAARPSARRRPNYRVNGGATSRRQRRRTWEIAAHACDEQGQAAFLAAGTRHAITKANIHKNTLSYIWGATGEGDAAGEQGRRRQSRRHRHRQSRGTAVRFRHGGHVGCHAIAARRVPSRCRQRLVWLRRSQCPAQHRARRAARRHSRRSLWFARHAQAGGPAVHRLHPR